MTQVFLVGGAVRDLMMGRTPKDFDFVVVGSTPQTMLDLGFEQVGADFPVFLHPETKDEFALARTERKVGEGHTGFDCEWEGVTLEEDLSRRDLTVNAMALPRGTLENQDNFIFVGVDGDKRHLMDLVDPFNGKADLESKTLRHVSEHFAEDPLRVLRVARFLARFGDEWGVDWSTALLCQELAQEGALSELTPERVWKEASRALMEGSPDMFFNFMDSLSEGEGNDFVFLPELTNLVGVEQRPDHHPEGDAFVHTLLCLRAAAKMNVDLPTMFAVLCHDFGKRPAFDMDMGHLGGHEEMGVPMVEALCDRWKVPNDCRKLAVTTARDHTKVHNLKDLRPATVAKMFTRWGMLQEGNKMFWSKVMSAATADARGRGEQFENVDHPSTPLMMCMAAEFKRKVNVAELFEGRPMPKDGKKVGEAVSQERVRRLKAVKALFLTTGV